ncbi:MAG: DMT family transporter [Gammaproteobacteria bacterium]|nr:DMT family transporter [Gammaproteobacteria bacterium]
MPALLLTTVAMLAFAANSILARLALTATAIDAVSFSVIRLLAGAVMLLLVLLMQQRQAVVNALITTCSLRTSNAIAIEWLAASALCLYAFGFSLAYRQLTAASGALLLFAAVQISMLSIAWWRGERLSARQWTGFALASTGVVYLLLPGIKAPPLVAAVLMLVAGVGWGVYTLLARQLGEPVQATTINFVRAAMLALLVLVVSLVWQRPQLDGQGMLLAMLSGAVTSGLGYVIWYAAVGRISTSTAAVAQLSVPLITALAGVWLLQEALTTRLLVSGLVILLGIALVSLPARNRRAEEGR